jgi:hypothetical protein
MNGPAGAAIGLGAFGLLVSIGLGFAFLPFAIIGALVGAVAVAVGARGRAFAHQTGSGSRLATAGVWCGAVAVVAGVAGVVVSIL